MADILIFVMRIAGLFDRKVGAAIVGSLLCLATVAVCVASLVLANADRLREQNAEERLDDSNGNDSEHPNEAEVSPALDIEIEANPNRGRASPRHDEENANEPDPPSSPDLPWSLLSMGNTTLCGAQTAPDDAAPPATNDADLDELIRLAIAAGVDRSEVTRLTHAHVANRKIPE